MIRIHNAGKGIILISFLIFLPLDLLFFLLINNWIISLALILASLVPLVLIVRFFRVPKRVFTMEEGYVVAPADGKVVVVERTMEEEFHKKEMIQVSIFMSIYNVHINWVPFRGTVSYLKYHPGKYLVARHPKSSSLNERSSVVISDGSRSILVKQIAGYVARRILTFVREKDQVEYGTELGFIRFGSRLDLFLPLDAEILVTPGEKTCGGVSKIARLSN